MIDRRIKKYSDRLIVLKDNLMAASPNDFYPYEVDIKHTQEFIMDLKKIKNHYKLGE